MLFGAYPECLCHLEISTQHKAFRVSFEKVYRFLPVPRKSCIKSLLNESCVRASLAKFGISVAM